MKRVQAFAIFILTRMTIYKKTTFVLLLYDKSSRSEILVFVRLLYIS